MAGENRKPEFPIWTFGSHRIQQEAVNSVVSILFATLLRDLCDTVPQPPQANGRPRLPLSDMLYGMGLKVYSTLSTRRAMSEIRGAVATGWMCREPSFSTPIRYFERPEVTPVLRELIQLSALPLRDLEIDFAQDSSGFASTSYNRWFDHKWGGSKKETKWVASGFRARSGAEPSDRLLACP